MSVTRWACKPMRKERLEGEHLLSEQNKLKNSESNFFATCSQMPRFMYFLYSYIDIKKKNCKRCYKVDLLAWHK